MTQYFRLMGAPDRAIESGQRAMAIAEALDDFALRVATNTHLGPAYRGLGDYRRAVEILTRNLESLPSDLTRDTFGLAGLPYVISCTNLVWCLAEMGEFAEAAARGADGLRVAEAAQQPYSVIFAHLSVGTVSLVKGELEPAISVLERALADCRTWNVPVLLPVAASVLGSAFTVAGRLAEAIPLLEEAVARAAAVGLLASEAIFVARLAEGYLLAGRRDEARRRGQRALELARERKERAHEAYARRLLGEVALRDEPPAADAVEASLRQALTLAMELGLRPLAAHCHLGLGRLYRRTGDRRGAEQALGTAARLFGEMDMRRGVAQGEAELALLGRSPSD